ncbi:14976_t:CDS:2 [Entrophospora sp. SA101]|nr:14976_t:CDS:2 [Entrophospora sp. SA101]
MNRLLILSFVLLTFFFVNTFSSEEVVPYKLIYSRPLILKRVGDNKVIVEVGWDGINEREDEPVRTRFKCFSNAVTVKGSHVKHGVFGDHKAQFELNIHKKNVNVKCRYGVIDIKVIEIPQSKTLCGHQVVWRQTQTNCASSVEVNHNSKQASNMKANVN